MSKFITLPYFQLPRHLWPLYLRRIHQLGYKGVFSPVPWGFHQPAPQRLDLDGHSLARRDVVSFAELCLGLNLSLRLDVTPGAPRSAGLLFNGLPAWLFRQHPDTQARNADNQPIYALTLEHPTTRQHLERWFQELGQALHHLSQKDLSLQLNLSSLPANHSEHVAKVQWPIWLRKRFAEGGIAALNAAYNTTYRRVSEVPLNAAIDAPAFQQDVAEFTAHLTSNTQDTLLDWLEGQALTLSEAIEWPPQAVQLTDSPADISQSLYQHLDAPLQNDGQAGATFAQFQQDRPDLAPNLEADESEASLRYQLGRNGQLEPISLNSPNPTEVDLDFTLPTESDPLPESLAIYLKTQLKSRQQALNHAESLLNTLLTALEPPTSKPEATSAGSTSPQSLPYSIHEARQGISEASLALQRAAASVGMLEDVFSTALNKPAPGQSASGENSPSALLTINPLELQAVRRKAAQALESLTVKLSVSSSLSVSDYQTAHQSLTQAATTATAPLNEALLWLREQLISGQISRPNWTVHHTLEIILHTLRSVNA